MRGCSSNVIRILSISSLRLYLCDVLIAETCWIEICWRNLTASSLYPLLILSLESLFRISQVFSRTDLELLWNGYRMVWNGMAFPFYGALSTYLYALFQLTAICRRALSISLFLWLVYLSTEVQTNQSLLIASSLTRIELYSSLNTLSIFGWSFSLVQILNSVFSSAVRTTQTRLGWYLTAIQFSDLLWPGTEYRSFKTFTLPIDLDPCAWL